MNHNYRINLYDVHIKAAVEGNLSCKWVDSPNTMNSVTAMEHFSFDSLYYIPHRKIPVI